MSRTLKVWVRSAVSVTALLLFGLEAEAACVLYYAPANSPTSTPVRYNVCDAAASFPTGTSEGDLAYDQATDTLYVWDGSAWDATGGGGGAPTTAQYWVGAPDGGLSAEKDLSALSTGLVINTGGTPSAYAGATCTNQVLTALSASGAGTCTTVTLASAQFANQGTTTTVLHGNAAGNPSFGSVDLANDTSSTLPLAKITDDVSSGLCLLSGGVGDPAWTTCPGGGGGLSYAQVAAAALAGF